VGDRYDELKARADKRITSLYDTCQLYNRRNKELEEELRLLKGIPLPSRERPEPDWWVVESGPEEISAWSPVRLFLSRSSADGWARRDSSKFPGEEIRVVPAYRSAPQETPDYRCPLCAEPLVVSCPRGHWGINTRALTKGET
jgi:hypothetical protein